MTRMISLIIIATGKDIIQHHTRIRNTEVQAMHTTFRSVHTTAFGTIAIIQQFGRKTREMGTFSRLEHERRNTGTVLSEIDHQGFTRTDNHFFTRGKFLGNDDLTKFLFLGTFHAFPKISLDWRQGQIVTQIDFCTGRRNNLTLELSIHFGSSQFFYGSISHRDASIVSFPVEDSRMGHRTGNTSLPVFQVSTIEFLRTIGIGQFQNTTESTLLTQESFMTMRSMNLVCPPTRSNLSRKLVLGTCFCLKGSSHIVGK